MPIPKLFGVLTEYVIVACRSVSVRLTLVTPLVGGPPGANLPAPTRTIGLPLAQAARSALKVYSVPTCASFTLRNHPPPQEELGRAKKDRKSTRLNSSHD